MPRNLAKVNPQHYKRGQAVLIILLVMLVGLSVGLVLIGRSTTELSISTKIEESARAFNAAEAGIEQAIRSAATGSSPVPLASGVSYQVTVNDLGVSAGGTIYPSSKTTLTRKGEVTTIWLVPHDPTTNDLIVDEARDYNHQFIVLCLHESVAPAVGVDVYYRDSAGIYRTSFLGIDGNATRAATNKFVVASTSGACSGHGYTYTYTIDFNSSFNVNLTQNNYIPIALRIKPFYSDSYIAVMPQGNPADFPTQGKDIESLGNAGESVRRIQVAEPFTQPAPFLDHALFSFGNSNLSK